MQLQSLVLLVVLSFANGAFDESTLNDSCFKNISNCCFNVGSKPWVQRTPRCVQSPDGSYPCAVKLGTNAWYGSFANNYLAKIFIEEFLGYPVEIEADYSAWTGLTSEQDVYGPEGDLEVKGQFRRLEDGEIDAILEVWPSGHQANKYEFTIERETVKDAGALGVIAAIGWYVPSFVLEGSGGGSYSADYLDYWRTYTNQEVADLFRNPASEIPCCKSSFYDPDQAVPCMPTEQYGGTPVAFGGMNSSTECDADPTQKIPTYGGRFMAGAVDWAQNDDQLLKNLNLNFTIEFATSEVELIHQVDLAIQNRDPLLLYFWEPHAIFSQFDLTKVMLPPYNQECADSKTNGGVNCDYPTEILYKVYSANLTDRAPDVAKLLDAMRFASSKDQETMLADNWFNGTNWNAAACSWVQDNEAQWSRWVDIVENQFANEYWQDVQPKKTVESCECNADGTRNVVGTYETNSLFTLDAVIISDTDVCSLGAGNYSSRWKTESLQSYIVEESDCSYLVADQGNSIVIIVIIAIVFLVGMMVGLLSLRKTKIMRASSLVTMFTFLVGAIILNASTLGRIGKPTTARCLMSTSLFIWGALLFIGSLLVKEYVVHKIFTQKLGRKQRNYKRVMMLAPWVITLFCIIYVSLWGIVIGFTPVSTQDSNFPEYENVQILSCPDGDSFATAIQGVIIFLLLISCFLSWQTRNITALFSEAKYIMISNYNVAFLGTVSFLLSNAMGDRMSAWLQVQIIGSSIAWCTTTSSGLIVATRIYAAVKNVAFDTKMGQSINHGSNSATVTAPTSVEPSMVQ